MSSGTKYKVNHIATSLTGLENKGISGSETNVFVQTNQAFVQDQNRS